MFGRVGAVFPSERFGRKYNFSWVALFTRAGRPKEVPTAYPPATPSEPSGMSTLLSALTIYTAGFAARVFLAVQDTTTTNLPAFLAVLDARRSDPCPRGLLTGTDPATSHQAWQL